MSPRAYFRDEYERCGLPTAFVSSSRIVFDVFVHGAFGDASHSGNLSSAITLPIQGDDCMRVRWVLLIPLSLWPLLLSLQDPVKDVDA